ncbi:sulfatase [candidate division KSB1 bacterium]
MDRRDFLRKAGIFSGGVMLSSSAPAFLKGRSKMEKPNIVFVTVDQMRGDALSCLGSPNARTPNLDNMAREGVIFENGYCNNPVCLPSRISMFTGLYPHQHGSPTNKGPHWKTVDGTLIKLFKDNGYRLGYVGKNHMMQVDKATYDKYFDYYKFIDREDFRRYSKYVTPFWHCDTHEPSEKCFTTTHTNEGIDFINTTDDPFFLFVSYQDPHPPYMAPSEYSSKFSSEDMVIPDYVPASKLSRRLHDYYKAMKFDEIKDSDITETMRYYYAAISYIDDNVGRIINSLERKGILDNTIVIFTSDHGDFMGEHRMVRKGIFLYDALLHVPMIWYCPGLIRNRFRVRNIAQSVDFMPTIRDFLNAETQSSLPGRSLKPILQGQTGVDKEQFAFASSLYHELQDNITGKGEMPERVKNMPLHSRVMRMPKVLDGNKRTASIRNLDWRYIRTTGKPDELYKMDRSWTEKENLAQKPEYNGLVSSFEKKVFEIWPE